MATSAFNRSVSEGSSIVHLNSLPSESLKPLVLGKNKRLDRMSTLEASDSLSDSCDEETEAQRIEKNLDGDHSPRGRPRRISIVDPKAKTSVSHF